MFDLLITNTSYFAAACKTKGITIIPSWYKYLDSETVAGTCSVKFAFTSADIGKILLAVIEILLRVGAIVAVFYVIYGGFQYLISQAEPDKVKNARQTIINALTGLVIASLGTAAVNLIGGRFL